MPSNNARSQVHVAVSTFEDLELLGGSAWRIECSCGFVTRPASTLGTATGIWRRHCVLSGR